MLTKYRVNGSNDPGRPADLDPVTYLKRLWLGQVPGRERLGARAKFIAVPSLLVQAAHLIVGVRQSDP